MRRGHDRLQAKAVEFAQGHHVHRAGLVQVFGRVVDSLKNVRFRLAHWIKGSCSI